MKLFFSLLISLVAAVTYAETDVEFLFDVSGSMAKKLNGEAQIDIARKALINSLKEIPSEELVALRVFAHRVEQTDKEGSCRDTELLVPFAPADIGSIALALGGLSPKGYTPIAYSLEKAAQDMIEAGRTREPSRVIILLSDGEETCGGDPVAVLKKLRSQGFNVIVHTIGFNVDEVARQQLQAIASFSGGKYFDASDGAKLGKAFEEATKESYLSDKSKDDYTAGVAIRGGDGFITAVEFKEEWLGKEVRLDHHLKGKEMDYFYINLKPAQVLTYSIRNLDKGIWIGRDGKVEEKDSPNSASITVHDENFKRLNYITAYSAFDKKEEIITVDSPRKLLFGLGAAGSGGIHKDGVIYGLSIKTHGDLGSDSDAGSTIATAMKLSPGTHPDNYIGDSDRKDTYALEAKAGESYTLTYRPAEGNTKSLDFDVVDDLNVRISQSSRGGGSGQGLRSTFQIPVDGTYYIIIGTYSGGKAGGYSLQLEKKEKGE